MGDVIKVKRKTTESVILVELDFNGLKENYRKGIQTKIPFLNHMIEHIAWRSGVNIDISYSLDEFELSHLICEDVAIAMGKGFLQYVNDNVVNGATGYGDGTGIIDEALANCAISFENRAYFNITYNGIDVPKETESMLTEDLETFLEGFVQGAMCTLHIDLVKGHNGHHIWEAIYRAFGIALGRAVYLDEKRKNMTAGVAGNIEFEIEKM